MASGIGSSDGDRDFAYFMRWKVNALKDQLRKYGLKVEGRKQDLAARVFAAYEMKLQPVKTLDEIRAERASDLEKCLVVGETQLPNPDTLKEGWLGEDRGLKLWPPIVLTDIRDYLGVDKIDKRVLQDYKERKGFSYFDSGKVKIR